MKPEIKQRIEQIKKGQVPQGYRKTKIGIVPCDWNIKRLKELTTYKTQKNKNNEFDITLTNSANLGIIRQNDYFDKIISNGENTSGYYVIEYGDYVYNPRISVTAPCGPINKSHILEIGIMSPLYTVFRFNEKNNDYYEHYFHSSHWYPYMNEIANYGARSDRMNITNSDFFNMPIPTPVFSEQQKIAEILSTQDKIIKFKERLIEEKQKQKKYLMQNLLTGEKRLNGFAGEWKFTKLSNYIFESNNRNKELKITRVFSVSNKHGFIDQGMQFGKTIASKDLSNYKIIEKGTIAYNPSRINVGSIALFNENDKGIVSPLYVVMKCKDELSSEFFMFFTQTNLFYRNMKTLLSGGVRNTLNFSDLCKFKIKIPLLDEQKAITDILSTADQEIKLLQKQLEEEKQKKKALMQLLLTGIVRV